MITELGILEKKSVYKCLKVENVHVGPPHYGSKASKIMHWGGFSHSLAPLTCSTALCSTAFHAAALRSTPLHSTLPRFAARSWVRKWRYTNKMTCLNLTQIQPIVHLLYYANQKESRAFLQVGIIIFKKRFQVLLKIFERSFILYQSQLCISNGFKATACQSESVFC